MQKREIFKKVGGILTELNDQYQYLSQNPESLNDLELELFLANANFLADHIEILRKLNNIQPPVADNQALPTPSALPSSEQPLVGKSELPSIRTMAAEETAFDYEQKPVDELFDRVLSAEEQAILERKKETMVEVAEQVAPQAVTSAPAIEHSPIAVPMAAPEIVPAEPVRAEAVKETVSEPAQVTINDLISSQVQATTVASRFHKNTVTDLKSIISLNDKLLFIKDLFNGYSLAYSEAIELVNRYDSLEAADNFLKHNYAVKNKWEDKPETLEKFYEILGRRFA